MTSSRRAEADRLGALGITSDPTELVQMLQALAVRKPEAAPVQPASTVKVFLEYRRDDARAYAGRLADRLRSHFGSDAVFMDIEAIQLGVDFVESLVQRWSPVTWCSHSLAPTGLARRTLRAGEDLTTPTTLCG